MAAISDFTFFHPLRVRWAECDAQGIVFNVNYFLYFDVAMTEYLRAMGVEGASMLEFFTVRAEADYRGSAQFDEEIEIGVRAARLGRTSMTFEMIIVRGGEVLTEGAMTYVNTEKDTKTPCPLPEAFTATILDFEKTAPKTRAHA